MRLKDIKDASKNVKNNVKKIGSKKNIVKPKTTITFNQPTPNPSHQQEQDEMQGHYDALQNIRNQRNAHAFNEINQYLAMSGPIKKELTDEQMDQMRINYLNSKAILAVLNFRNEIDGLVKQYEATAPEEILTAARALSAALTKSTSAGFKDYLTNQTELSIVENNLFRDSQHLIEQYSPAIEEDPSFFASFLRVINYLFGSCMATEFSTSTVFCDSANYLLLKNSIFRPEVKETQIVNDDEVNSQIYNSK